MKSLIKIVIGMAIVALISTAIVYAVFQYPFQQYATIAPREEITVYEDEDLTIRLGSLNWGTVSIGNNNVRIVYVKNTGSVEVGLSFTADLQNLPGWSETCVFGTSTLLPDEATTATLTLTVPPTALAGNYDWPSEITATAI